MLRVVIARIEECLREQVGQRRGQCGERFGQRGELTSALDVIFVFETCVDARCDLAELTVIVTKSVSIEATHAAATMRPKGRMHALTGGQARFSH